jgi:hypothetical protein
MVKLGTKTSDIIDVLVLDDPDAADDPCNFQVFVCLALLGTVSTSHSTSYGLTFANPWTCILFRRMRNIAW